jgi:hypothetical protein
MIQENELEAVRKCLPTGIGNCAKTELKMRHLNILHRGRDGPAGRTNSADLAAKRPAAVP